MAVTTTMPLLYPSLFFFFSLFFRQSQARAHPRDAPAMYVFGDSVMDPGNNIFLETHVKVNFTPYGVDFPAGPTGRFTNGYTIADFWYTWFGVRSKEPIPLPYMHPLSRQKPNTKGFNYASGTAGIFPDTGSTLGKNLPLGQQVKLFGDTAQQYLPSLGAYKNKAKLSQALSESIFVVCMGGNDYINYLQPGFNTSKLYNPQQFGEFLVNELGNHLQDLYKVGARKFVVFEIAPLGCLPDFIDKTKPSTLCNEKINGFVSIFNKNLGVKLNKLKSMLDGSTFVTAKAYQLIYDIVHNPLHHGFADARYPCCASGSNGTGDCKPGTVPCRNRGSRVFWDTVHPTEVLYRRIAGDCFNGKGLCTPMNIVQLAGER
ncbi:GDSL esterase/lipase [Actinidia chinensis var. chinensis]|uniref:GDSL esterase/lipase n=1 Tax=Actinidia chinensis var. chinensis TaxID=1590841 RepID=A0A2R6QGG2_ACTCC|nr:GDSL esterase/lipase [Actinidia chinensis var. chinensis]